MKYSKDGPFIEPVVRCDSCVELILVKDLKEIGMCPECGNTRIRNVKTLSESEMSDMKAKGIDPDWIALFEEYELGGDDAKN